MPRRGLVSLAYSQYEVEAPKGQFPADRPLRAGVRDVADTE